MGTAAGGKGKNGAETEAAKGSKKAAAKAAAAAAAAAAAGTAGVAVAAGAEELRVGSSVTAVVELVKPLAAGGGYVVLSLPGHGHALAFAACTDFNQQAAEHVTWKPQPGQSFTDAVVACLPSGATGGRLLLRVPLHQSAPKGGVTKGAGGGAAGTAGGGGKAGQKATKGTIVSGVVTAIHGAHMDVQVRV